MVDDRRHLLLGHPGIHVHPGAAGAALIERGVDERDLAAIDDRQAGIARGAGFHRDQGIHLLLKHQRIERLLRALGAAAVVGDDQLERPAEHAAGGVDLLDGELSGLDHRRRHHAVGAAEPDRNPDLDRFLSVAEPRPSRAGRPGPCRPASSGIAVSSDASPSAVAIGFVQCQPGRAAAPSISLYTSVLRSRNT